MVGKWERARWGHCTGGEGRGYYLNWKSKTDGEGSEYRVGQHANRPFSPT